MNMSLKELLEMKLPTVKLCPDCGRDLHGLKLNQGDHCDCYWDKLGDLLEKHPPRGMIRGVTKTDR